MERDPVCGRRIEPSKALHLEYHGKTYYFCSHACKQDFEDRPEEYTEHPSGMLYDRFVDKRLQTIAVSVQEGAAAVGH
jgi:YHS domain-containing protein